MDPAVILPYHIFEEIFSYIDHRDVQKMVTVSKLWYKLITSSCNLEKNSVLAIRNDWINDEEDLKTIIECSKNRNFHSILLSDCSKMYKEIVEIVSYPKCSIRNVTIFDMKFKNFRNFATFVKHFETSLRELTMEKIEIENGDEFEVFQMKNLQQLKLANCSPQIYLPLLANTPKLTSLELAIGVEFDVKLRGILKELKQLKKLSINNELLCSLLNDDEDEEKISDVKFQLIDLAITSIGFAIPISALLSIEKFLETQNSLEEIYFNEWLSFDILKCALRMKKLKELSLYSLPSHSWANQLPTSNSIEILDVRTFHYDENCEDLKKLLAAVPNAKHLKLRAINDEISQFIEQNLKHVTTISLIHPAFIDPLPNVSFE